MECQTIIHDKLTEELADKAGGSKEAEPFGVSGGKIRPAYKR